jgi:hypothetical protein
LQPCYLFGSTDNRCAHRQLDFSPLTQNLDPIAMAFTRFPGSFPAFPVLTGADVTGTSATALATAINGGTLNVVSDGAIF